ncbi:hypothetical protein KY312_00565 [Candidatus Woesearchaeota archaeon]|nr:hypothetical protein [Candidatus Woesearchaeota archaeon]
MSYTIDYTVSGNRASSSYSTSSSGYSGGFSPYSVLENKVHYGKSSNKMYASNKPAPVVVEQKPTIIYDKSGGYSNKVSNKVDSYYKNNNQNQFQAEMFLSANRKNVKFVKASGEIQKLVEQTFQLLTKKPLPNFNIRVCTPKEMRKAHPNWHESIRGFAQPGTQSIFVLEAPLDELMVTIGHEIGHLLARSAENEQDEEAKAFAFCIAWIRTIKEHNIGGLGDNLVIPTPAKNGLHDKAWEFIQGLIKAGENPIGLFYQLSSGYIRHQNL